MNRLKRVALLGSTCLAAALCVCAAVNAEEAKEAKGPTISRFLLKPLKEAQEAKNKQDYATEVQKLHEAMNAKGERTPYDNYIINSWLGVADVSLHNYEEGVPALEASAESQYSSAAQRKAMLQAVVSIYSQLHQYPKAIAAGQNAIKRDAAEPDVYVIVAADQDIVGQHKEAAATIQQLIEKEPKPQEKYLQFQWEAYTKAGDQADAGKVIDKLVTYYPKPDYWLNALQPLLKMNISDAHLQLDVYRLMSDVGVLKMPRDYAEMAELSFDAGYPGETVTVLQKAFADHIFTDQRDVLRYQHLLTGAQQKATQDQASLSSQQSKATTTAGGDALVAVGAAYLSYGQPQLAAQLIAQGIAKGGLRSNDQANLLLGIAQLRSHQLADAHRSFGKVADSSNQGYAQLGRLWVLHSQAQHAA